MVLTHHDRRFAAERPRHIHEMGNFYQTQALKFKSMLPSMLSLQRRFQIWLYTVSHGQLLIRSNRSAQHATRVDVLFKDVAVMELPMCFDGLVVIEASDAEAGNLNIQLGAQRIFDRNVFVIQGSNFEGYVVAGAVFWHVDEGRHFDESYFQKSFANLGV